MRFLRSWACLLLVLDLGCDNRALGTDSGAVDASAVLPDVRIPDIGPPREVRWEQLGAAGLKPPGRMNHVAVYDDQKDRLLVLGGFDPYLPEGGCCTSPYQVHNDIWQLDLQTDTWTHVADLSAPLMAFNPTEVGLDRVKNRLVLVGVTQSEHYGPAVSLSVDLTSWSVTTLPAPPTGGQWPLRVAFDAAGRRMVLHDGYSTAAVRGAWTFSLDSDTWTKLAVADGPALRYHAPLTGAAGRALLFGGYDGDTVVADLWQLDLQGEKWTQLTLPAGLRGRWSHRAVFDVARDTLVVFGGSRHGSNEMLETMLIHRDTLQIDEPTLSPSPVRRRDHTLVLDTRRRRALMYGGAFESDHVFDDVWALQLP